MNHKPLIFAVDFDRTLCDTDHVVAPYKIGPPLPGAVEAIQKLKRTGHCVIIHTCRSNDKQRAIAVVENWLNFFEIPFDYIWTSEHGAKPVADFYIDDRGLHFQNWNTTLEEIERRIVNEGG